MLISGSKLEFYKTKLADFNAEHKVLTKELEDMGFDLTNPEETLKQLEEEIKSLGARQDKLNEELNDLLASVKRFDDDEL